MSAATANTRCARRLGPTRLLALLLAGSITAVASLHATAGARAMGLIEVGQIPLSNGSGGYGYGYGLSYPYSGYSYPYPGAYYYPSQASAAAAAAVNTGAAPAANAGYVVTSGYGETAPLHGYAGSGSYCTTTDGNQIWVPSGADPAGMGC